MLWIFFNKAVKLACNYNSIQQIELFNWVKLKSHRCFCFQAKSLQTSLSSSAESLLVLPSSSLSCSAKASNSSASSSWSTDESSQATYWNGSEDHRLYQVSHCHTSNICDKRSKTYSASQWLSLEVGPQSFCCQSLVQCGWQVEWTAFGPILTQTVPVAVYIHPSLGRLGNPTPSHQAGPQLEQLRKKETWVWEIFCPDKQQYLIKISHPLFRLCQHMQGRWCPNAHMFL